MQFSPNIRASLFMLLSMLGFVVNDLIIKSLDGALPTGQIMWLRGVFLALIILALAYYRGIVNRVVEVLSVKVLSRSLLECGATVLFLMALVRMPYANIAAVLMFLPLAVTIGAALFLNEPIGWRRWLAILIGLGGVLIIIRPGMGGFDIASIYILASVVLAALRDITTRTLPERLPSLLVAGAAAVTISLLGMAMTLIQHNWEPVTFTQWTRLASSAFFLFFGYQFVILSMRTGEIAYVVPFRYSVILWAILLAYLFFDELPDRQTILGSSIVVAMGLYTLYREVRLAKA